MLRAAKSWDELLKVCPCCADLTEAAASHVSRALLMSCMQQACRAQSPRDKHVHHSSTDLRHACTYKLSVRYLNRIITQNRTHDNIVQQHSKRILGCCYSCAHGLRGDKRENLISNTLMITLATIRWRVSCFPVSVCELSDVCLDRQEFKCGGRRARTFTQWTAPSHTRP